MDTDWGEGGGHSIDGGEDERQFACPHLLPILATPITNLVLFLTHGFGFNNSSCQPKIFNS